MQMGAISQSFRMKKIGIVSSSALIIGNMIGSGIFLLPASLALYGGISLIGWVCSATGALLLALIFSALSKRYPDVVGGPYAYCKKVLGNYVGFIVGWGYWVSIWCTNAAIAVAFVGYLTVIIPGIAAHNSYMALAGASVLWLCSGLNFLPLYTISVVQKWITILKVIPIVVLCFVGFWFVDWRSISFGNLSTTTTFGAITATTTLTLFAFLGLEAATIASKYVSNSKKTVGQAGIISILITAFLYLFSSAIIFGLLPFSTLQNSTAPFADATGVFLGDAARTVVAVIALLVTFGALNGWMLIQGLIPHAMVKDGLFPKVFGKENKYGTPYLGIVISSCLATGVLLLRYTDSLIELFSFMMNLSTLSVLTPYLFSIVSLYLVLAKQAPLNLGMQLLLGASFSFCIWMVFGVGWEVFMYGIGLILFGVILYELKIKRSK